MIENSFCFDNKKIYYYIPKFKLYDRINSEKFICIRGEYGNEMLYMWKRNKSMVRR